MLSLALLPLLAALALRAEEISLIEGEKPADAKPTVREGDSSKILKAYTFEESTEGWNSEQDEAYKPWSKCEHAAPGFRGSSGALKTTIPNQWGSLGPFISVEYAGNGTHITVAYRTKGCQSLTCQGKVTAIKKQLHGAAPTFKDGEWTVESFETAIWAPWSGAEAGKDSQFSTLMVYAGSKDGRSEFLLDDVVLWDGKDISPPDKVRRATARVDLNSGKVELKWAVPVDNIAVAKFEIHRSLSPNFTASAENLIGTTSDNTYRDGSLNNFGVYYYRFVAEDASGNLSETSLPLKVEVKE